MMSRRQFHVALVVLVMSGFAGGAVAHWLLPAQPAWAQDGYVQQVVRAEEFELVDEAGRPRGLLQMSAGDPRLSLIDNNGNVRAEMAILRGEPGVAILDRNGTVRAELFMSDGLARLCIRDAGGEDRAVVGAIQTRYAGGHAVDWPESTISLFDANGNLGYQVDEAAPLDLWDY
ncbi:MAG: hypothetical protein GF393_04310 [Armatimonadia bacterium]|nr:hypothetical protein [Armatimonadia bacterium]